jgi:hypothetical protein
MLADFRGFLDRRAHEYEAEKFAEHRDVIALRLKAQITRVKWDQAEESRVLTSGDPQVQRALELFGEAEELARRGARGRPGDKPPTGLRAQANPDIKDNKDE